MMKRFYAIIASFAVLVFTSAYTEMAQAEERVFDMTIEDTMITLVGGQTFHTFAFNGQVPGPFLHVKEGDDLVVNVTNFTTLPHTIHWHGLYQKDTWRNDGVPDTTQKAIAPGETFTYRFKASPSGTMWYHCHVNVNEHVSMRGMWGPLIIDPKDPLPIEKKVTRDFTLMFSSWASKWADKPGYGGIPGDVFDFYTVNGKAFPDNQPLRVKKGDIVRIRLLAVGDSLHSIHLHGHVFEVIRKDGHALPQPYKADTLLIAPGERYDIVFEANNPGRWMIHDHIDLHTVNGNKPMGGAMAVLEYTEVGTDDEFYVWRNKKYQPDYYLEESIKKPYGLHEIPQFRGTPIE